MHALTAYAIRTRARPTPRDRRGDAMHKLKLKAMMVGFWTMLNTKPFGPESDDLIKLHNTIKLQLIRFWLNLNENKQIYSRSSKFYSQRIQQGWIVELHIHHDLITEYIIDTRIPGSISSWLRKLNYSASSEHHINNPFNTKASR